MQDTVPIAVRIAVDYRGQVIDRFGKSMTCPPDLFEKYSAKSSDFLRFLLYLCHVIDDFACLDLQH